MLALTILGNNSAVPAYNRNPTAQVLQHLEENYLIDCGEGTQMQLARYKIRRSKINHIFISHLHGDHYFGLIGLLNSMSLLGRKQDLHIYAPAKLKAIIDIQMEASESELAFPLHFHPLNEEGIILNDNKIQVNCFKVSHRIECYGFLFKQKKNPRKINPERAQAYEIPNSFYDKLQAGHDYVTKKGTIIPNEEVTVANLPIKSYAFCGDTLYDESIIDKVRGVDLLYHETTYLKGSEDRAAAYFHSTTIQAATIALKAEVKKLLIGHFSSKYETLETYLEEALTVFENTELALEGNCYKC
ncbi:MAG: ribonuclease Z [Ferruginibacter sp.]